MKKEILHSANKSGVRIAGWSDVSCDDGPGLRSVLFFQGCSKKCPDCHNLGTHDPNGGTWYELMDLIEIIEERCPQKMITISGGEPMEQEEGLVALLMVLKKKGFDVCLYTGRQENEIPDGVLNLINYLKTGSFVRRLSNKDLQYVGSANQKFFRVVDGKKELLIN